MAGLDQHKNPFATMITDSMGGGFGALSWRDGVDTGGVPCIPMGKMPDVEMNEFSYPMLYLWRREEVDSGGPGTFRGGVGGSLCFVFHKAPGPVAGVIAGSGKAVPMNLGIAGGYPGSTQIDLTIRRANAEELMRGAVIPQDLDQIEGEVELHGCEEEVLYLPGDVHFMRWQAGGGFGDPLLRDPAAVATDVTQGKVSTEAARHVYGVMIAADGTADAGATETLRRDIRNERRAGIVARGSADV